ncbi:MAG: GNAT family N-acetyltransferase [Flavobacteriales bacterium]
MEKIWTWDNQLQKNIHKSDFTASQTKIIQHNGKEIGFLVLKETFDEIYIENLLIEIDYQNLGIGKAVMENIIEQANSEQKFIQLQVFKINNKARNFYVKLGFEKISETEHHIGMKKNWLQQRTEAK